MSFLRGLFCGVCLCLCFAATGYCQSEIVLSEFRQGYLTWTNVDADLYYTVEWRPSMSGTDDWSAAYQQLLDVHSSSATITRPVPVFFRVAGHTNPEYIRVISADSAEIKAGFYEAAVLTDVDPDLDAGNILLGVSVFGVEGSLLPSGGTAYPEHVADGKTFYGADQSNWVLQVGTADYFEFVLDPQGIYVSITDPAADDGVDSGLGPVGTGPGHRPCLTIAHGLSRAVATGRTNVYVANGVYDGSLSLANGVNLKGGYHPKNWSRDLSNTLTVVRGSNAGQHKKTVVGSAITQPLVVEGFVFFGQNATQAGGNSYVFGLNSCDGAISIVNNTFFTGNGANGSRGVSGGGGASGGNGGQGLDATSSCQARSGGSGGLNTCNAGIVDGGDGGGNACPPIYDESPATAQGANGEGPSPGTGGAGGYNPRLESGGGCTLPTMGSVHGAGGDSGADGANGASGSGASPEDGIIVGGEWSGVMGQAGGDGVRGSGGGGGGAGGSAANNGGGTTSGATGGGGGAGGCNGDGGSSGTAGGGSFAIFVNGGTAPVIEDNLIYCGVGGNGGDGGAGGTGGEGGSGGLGGVGTIFCSGNGGIGGDGGDGGHGGGAGGGAGGVSYGILTSGAGTGHLYASLNTIVTGTAGAGGLGGASLGSPGTAGSAGQSAATDYR